MRAAAQEGGCKGCFIVSWIMESSYKLCVSLEVVAEEVWSFISHQGVFFLCILLWNKDVGSLFSLAGTDLSVIQSPFDCACDVVSAFSQTVEPSHLEDVSLLDWLGLHWWLLDE